MRKIRLKQFAAGFLVVLSLLVSAVSACTCASHGSLQREASREHCQTTPPLPAQKHSHGIKTGSPHSHNEAGQQLQHQHDHDDRAKTEAVLQSFSETECCCVKPAPKVFAKVENFKSEKQTAGALPARQVEIVLTRQAFSGKSPRFTTPFYLSDSFYNLAPGRAPPRL